MRRTFWRAVTGLAVVVSTWVVLEKSVAAHCLGGRGLYNCCCQAAACGDASSADCDAGTGQHVAKKSYRSYGSHYGYAKPVIHRTDKLSARNRNGGIR